MSGEDEEDWFERALREGKTEVSADEAGAEAAEVEREGESPFEEDFAAAFEGAPGPDDDFGGAVGTGGQPEEFGGSPTSRTSRGSGSASRGWTT